MVPLVLAGCATGGNIRVYQPEVLQRAAKDPRILVPDPKGLVPFHRPSVGLFMAYGVFDSAHVESQYKRDTIEIIVLPSKNKNSKIAVRHLRNRDWQKALGLFEQAKKEDPNDHRSIFGIGVCMEKLGDDFLASRKFSSKNISDILGPSLSNYKSALEQFKAAVVLYIDSKYEASRDRAEMKIKTLTQDNPNQSSAPPH